MKRQYLKLILILVSLLLCACSAKPAETVHVPTPTPADIYAATPMPTVTPAPLPESEQRALIERNRGLWAFEDEYYTPWFYTVTDLDHNGRLEILSASTQGSGIFTYARFYEVLPDGSGLINCYHRGTENEGQDDWPEIILDTLDCYYDAEHDTYYYPCEGITRDGVAHQYYAWHALSLKDGTAEWELLASKSVEWDADGAAHTSCMNPQGQTISEFDYAAAAERRFAGMEKTQLRLDWTRVDPAEQPTPQSTPQAQPADQPQVSGPVTITKDPTSETIPAGGKTWFIAHAANATRLTWLLTSPQGQTYTLNEAMDANPGLLLQELEEDTLAVSNVPSSVDGWSVQARFDGPGGSAVTSPAMIYIDDYMTAYGAVISAYYRAYTGGNTTGEYAWNNGISELIAYSQHVGYALEDLNGDGFPELIIAGIGTDNFSGGILYDLYTLVNGEPVRLAVSQARDRYYLRTDGSILNEGSGGAGHSVFILNRVTGDMLSPYEAVFTYFDNAPSDGYYHQTDGYSYEPRDYDAFISEDDFNYLVEYWESLIYVPDLSMIA